MYSVLHLSSLAKWERGEHENTVLKHPVRMVFKNVEIR